MTVPSDQPAPSSGNDARAADRARLGTTLAGQVRHSIETLIGRAAVERGLASREQVIMAFEELKQLPKEERAARFAEVFVRRGVLSAEQIETLRAWVRDDAAGGAGPDPSGSSMVAAAAVSTEPVIPGYRFVRKLGAGAMGTVVLARQESLDRLVAIKLLPPKFARDPLYIDRFFKEGKAAARLNDPNIVAAYDVGCAPNGMYYFVMEYIDGDTVFDRIQAKRRIPEADALRIARQAASALSHAHAKGFIHRDVKPKNLMINKAGTLKLADLGLARAGDDATAASEEKGKIFGTPYYISPEQIRGSVDIGPPADIYGLGATLYHMVTGKVPFEGSTPSQVMHKHLKSPLVPPDHLNPHISANTALIIETMLKKDARQRYQNARQLLRDLELALAGQEPEFAKPAVDLSTIATSVHSTSAEPVQPVRRDPTGALASPLVIVLIAVATLSVLANIALGILLVAR